MGGHTRNKQSVRARHATMLAAVEKTGCNGGVFGPAQPGQSPGPQSRQQEPTRTDVADDDQVCNNQRDKAVGT